MCTNLQFGYPSNIGLPSSRNIDTCKDHHAFINNIVAYVRLIDECLKGVRTLICTGDVMCWYGRYWMRRLLGQRSSRYHELHYMMKYNNKYHSPTSAPLSQRQLLKLRTNCPGVNFVWLVSFVT